MSSAITRWLFETHPNLGMAIMYGTLNAIGDCCAQFGLSSSSYNFARTLRFLIFGMGIAPLAGMWNAYLENRYPLRQKPQVNPADAVPLERIVISSTASPMMMSSPRIGSEKMHHRRTSSSASAIAQRPAEALMAPEQPPQKISMFVLSKRLAWDQIFMAPISFIIFLVCMGLMEGLGPSDIVTKCVNNLWPILWTNWKVWPIIQIVMFLYVPLKYRVPLAGVCNVLWTIWLSWQNAK